MFIEWCSHCETEQELDESLGLIEHKCECGERLLPCRLCTDMHEAYSEVFGSEISTPCANCPFDCKERIVGDKSTEEEAHDEGYDFCTKCEADAGLHDNGLCAECNKDLA